MVKKSLDNLTTSDKLKIYPYDYQLGHSTFDHISNLDQYGWTDGDDLIMILNDTEFNSSFYSLYMHELVQLPPELRDKYFNINNFKEIYFKGFPPTTKYVFLDLNAESLLQSPEFILDWLNLNNVETYLISSRLAEIKHPRASVGLEYLPILYMFLQQNFRQFPMLNYSPPSNPKYDFITYLGRDPNDNKRGRRFDIINRMFRNDLHGVKYKDDLELENSVDLFGSGKSGHYWNILNSLSGKIQIIFESCSLITTDGSHVSSADNNAYFFSEKIMKCFILPHPYLLIINKYFLNKLEKFGFKFHESSKADTIKGFVNIMDNIKRDPDKWISENKLCFEHNQRNLYQLSKSIELPHHIILKNLILN